MASAGRRAEWIWVHPPRKELAGMIPRGEADFSRDLNRFVYFRKEFELPGEPGSAIARASADGRYILYLNGIRLGRGPARCHPGWQYFDSYDMKINLKPGKNLLAALVHSYGRDSSWYELPRGSQAILFGCGGFFFDSTIASPRCDTSPVSDASWKFLVSEAWERDTPFGGTGFVEHFDAEREPEGWNRDGFDDSAWESALVQRIVLPGAGSDILPFPRLVERDIGILREEEVRPQRFIPIRPARDTVSVPDTAPASDALLDPGGINAIAVFSPLPGESSGGVFDFGEILPGRIRFEVDAASGSEVEIECGESLDEDGRIHRPDLVPGIFTPMVHRFRLREGRQSHELFELAGFRYLGFRASGCARPLVLLSMIALESSYAGSTAPRPESGIREVDREGDGGGDGDGGSGHFECSDEELTALWRAGARTASVCRQDGLIDCPSREQRQWTGDPYIQALINFVTLADTRLVRKYLLQSGQTQKPDGMIMMASTSDIGAEGRTFIPDFCLHWILAIDKYILYTGDGSILFELFPAVAKALAWFIPWIDGYGLIADLPGWIFIDWSEELDRQGEVLALNALFVAALRAGARIARLVEAPLYGDLWESLASSVAAAADMRLWDDKRGLYADARTTAGLSAVASQQGNAAALAFGIATPDRADAVLSAILDESKLRLTRTWRWDSERPFDPSRDIVMSQPFFSHFLHLALASANRMDDMIANMKRRWMPLLLGDDTFRESWQLTGMTSRCHGFSATPTYDLSTWILGVRPVGDGFSRYIIVPRFGGLEWARGRVPTPAGMISVEWLHEGSSVHIDIDAPVGLSGELLLPQKAMAVPSPPGAAQGAAHGRAYDAAYDRAYSEARGAAVFALGEGRNSFIVASE